MQFQGVFLFCVLVFGTDAKWFQNLANNDLLKSMVVESIMGADIDGKAAQILDSVPNKTCSQHLSHYIDGVKYLQLWAFKMIDSSAKFPESLLTTLDVFLGNYDECVGVKNVETMSGSFSGRYCLVRVCSAEQAECIPTKRAESKDMLVQIRKLGEQGVDFMDLMTTLSTILDRAMVKVAMCLPSTCSARDIEIFLNTLVEEVTQDIRINVLEKECSSETRHSFGALDYFTILILLIVLGLVVCSTGYDLLHQKPEERREVYAAFSVYSNTKRLVDTTVRSNELLCVHGIRVLSIAWVVLGYRYMQDANVPIVNRLRFLEIYAERSSLLVISAIFSVDTFFTIGGMLLAYGFLNMMAERKSFKLGQFYVHRLIRLFPAMTVMVLLSASLLTKLGDGPLWDVLGENDCDTTWWHSFLLIKSYKMPSTCMSASWYLTADMQLYLLSPLILLPLCKRPRNGRLILLGCTFLSWFIPFVQVYVEELRNPLTAAVSEEEIRRGFQRSFFPTHNRCASWFVGVGLGYLLHTLKIGEFKLNFKKRTVIIAWLVVLMIMVSCGYSIRTYTQPDYEYDRLREAFWIASMHLIWSYAIALAIFLCVTGNGGPINKMLSQPFWFPVSRLTFSIYLVHMSVQQYLSISLRSPLHFSHQASIIKFFGDMTLSIVAGVILSLTFESPILVLEKQVSRRESNKHELLNKVTVADTEKHKMKNGI